MYCAKIQSKINEKGITKNVSNQHTQISVISKPFTTEPADYRKTTAQSQFSNIRPYQAEYLMI